MARKARKGYPKAPYAATGFTTSKAIVAGDSIILVQKKLRKKMKVTRSNVGSRARQPR